MPVFDNLQTSVFDTTLAIMGQPATWLSEDGDVSGMVHFKDATNDRRIIRGFEFNASTYTAEYKFGDFPGLFDLIQRKVGEQVLRIDSHDYTCASIQALHDGKTYLIQLIPV